MNMCPTNKCKSTPESCLKGQVFFILTNCSNQEILKTRISLLGGKVEEFLSKDVTTLLVEDNQLIGQELLPDLSVKTTYNTVNGTIVASFPYPGSLSNIPSTSRGYNFIATNTSSKYSPYRLICYARQYGIQVVGIAQFLTWTEPQFKVIRQKQPRKASENISNLSGYFIKFESVNKNYRPCYKMFNNDPDRLVPLKNASVLVKPEACNVILNKPVVVTKHIQLTHMDPIVRPTHQGKGANLPVKVNEKKPQNNRPRPKEDNNYCECCKTHFADFKQHIKSSKHQSFVSNDKNYESVHNILKMLPTAQEFIESLQKPSPDSDPALTNGDNSATMPVANIPETDYSVPLNLEVRRGENVTGTTVQVSTHIGKNNNGNNLQAKKEEVMPLPLDLHIKRNDEIKVEIKQETNLFDNCEEVGLHKKEEINLLQVKQEPVNEVIMGNIKVDDKQPNELLDGMQCDESNGGDFFDKTNTAALAQLCLKNFDSYWLDSLPCEVEDMEFDDIFAFDDGKAKVDDEGFEPFVDNIINSEVPQTPGLVSGISNSNLKTDNTSIFMNTSVDVKDFIKTEPSNQESFLSTCKLGKENETSVSPLNIPVSFNDSLSLENKKPIFSIASFCSDKIGIEATPSCSNTIPSKNLEPLFSDESSDDENGNVLISNALNFITNSDNEGKIDKESSDENSLQEKFKVNTSLKKDVAASGSKSKQTEAAKNDLLKVEPLCKESSTATEINMPVKNSEGKNFMGNSNVARSKTSFQNVEELSKVSSSISDDLKHQNERSTKKSKVCSSKNSKSISVSNENSTNMKAKTELSCVTKTQKGSSSSKNHTNELFPSNIKNDLEIHKESNLQEKEWDYTCNKIYKKYPVPLNRSLDGTKVLNEKSPSKGKEVSASLQSKHLEEIKINQKSSEKYPNPKKNISMREMAVKQNNSGVSSAVNANVCEGVNSSNYLTSTPIKSASSKEINSVKMEKKNEVNIDKKEKVNITPVKTVPPDRKVDQISFKPYISDETDRKGSLERRQNIERNIQSNAYMSDLSKPAVYESRITQNSYMDVSQFKSISHKQELFYSTKANFDTSTEIHDLSSPNKHISPVNSLSLEKNECQSINTIDSSIKKFEKDVISKPAALNHPNVSATTVSPTSLENRVNYMNYKFMTHQNVSPEGKVNKNISQITETDTSHSTLDLSCLSLKSVPNKNKTSKPYCDVVTYTKSAHLPEGKIPKESRDKPGIKNTINVSNTKAVSMNQSSGDNRALTGEKHPKKVNSAKTISTASDKSIKSVDVHQNDVKSSNCDVASVKKPYLPEEKILSKEKHNPPENASLSIPNSNSISINQGTWKSTPNTIPYNVSAPVKNLIPQEEEMSHKEDVMNTCLNLSTSKTADHVIHEKTSKRCGDFTSIENLISRDKSPGEVQHNPEQVCSNSSNVSGESRSQVSVERNLSQHPSNAVVSVKTPLQLERHSDKGRLNSEMKVSSKTPKPSVVSEKQASVVGKQNQISCDAPKNLHSHQESVKKRTSIQTNVKLSISNTSVSGRGNNVNQTDGLSKKTILKQDSISRKRKEHPEAVNSSNTNSVSVSYTEKKDHCTNYEYFVPFKRKKVHRKEKKVRKKMKHNPVSVIKHSVSEKFSTGQPSRSSTNPCQYSYRTAKYNMDTSSSALPVKSSMEKQTLKIPHHKKQSSRRIELPPLWTVSVNGVKLKFTRVYPKKVDTYQYVTEDDSD